MYKLPPTDPRFLAMTTEMILLEREHYMLDHPEIKGKDAFVDPEYDIWERKQIEEDRKLYIPGESNRRAEIDRKAQYSNRVEKDSDDQWEEVE